MRKIEIGNIYTNKNDNLNIGTDLKYKYVILSLQENIWSLLEFALASNGKPFGSDRIRKFTDKEIGDYLKYIGKI